MTAHRATFVSRSMELEPRLAEVAVKVGLRLQRTGPADDPRLGGAAVVRGLPNMPPGRVVS